jgi:hypothetical protein
MASAQKGLFKLPQLAAGACLLIFVYHLLASYQGVAVLHETQDIARVLSNKETATHTHAAAKAVAVAPPPAAEAAAAAKQHTMSLAAQMLRPVVKVVEGMRFSEGAGVQIRRTVSAAQLLKRHGQILLG